MRELKKERKKDTPSPQPAMSPSILLQQVKAGRFFDGDRFRKLSEMKTDCQKTNWKDFWFSVSAIFMPLFKYFPLFKQHQ